MIEGRVELKPEIEYALGRMFVKFQNGEMYASGRGRRSEMIMGCLGFVVLQCSLSCANSKLLGRIAPFGANCAHACFVFGLGKEATHA